MDAKIQAAGGSIDLAIKKSQAVDAHLRIGKSAPGNRFLDQVGLHLQQQQ